MLFYLFLTLLLLIMNTISYNNKGNNVLPSYQKNIDEEARLFIIYLSTVVKNSRPLPISVASVADLVNIILYYEYYVCICMI